MAAISRRHRFRWLIGLLIMLGLLPSLRSEKEPPPATESVASTVDVLCARAERWMSLRQIELAIAHYRDAAGLDPDAYPARFGLAKALWAKGRSDEALAEVAQAERTAGNPSDRAAAFMLEATIHAGEGALVAAQQAVDTAFAVEPAHGDIAWYLQRVYIQRRLGHFDACLEGLEDGRIRTGNAILHALWVDVLIDAGEPKRALKEIDLQLRQAAVKSSWRIRRARTLLATGGRDEAETELKEALAELEARMQPDAEHPDISLYVERGSALALLGRSEEARRDLEAAKEAGANDAMLWRLRRDLGN